MPANDKVVHKGKVYYSVGATARMLSTTATKVREMMGRGDLEWAQLRASGRILITADSIVAQKNVWVDKEDGRQPRSRRHR